MGKPKLNYIRSVNFGHAGNPARIIVEKFVELHTKAAFSELIRSLVLKEFTDDPLYKEWRIKSEIYELKEARKRVVAMVDKRTACENKLRELDIDPDDVR